MLEIMQTTIAEKAEIKLLTITVSNVLPPYNALVAMYKTFTVICILAAVPDAVFLTPIENVLPFMPQ